MLNGEKSLPKNQKNISSHQRKGILERQSIRKKEVVLYKMVFSF
jgi:hypothetical protein